MDSVVHIAMITGVASLAFAWFRMGLFGGPSQEDLDAVKADRDELKKKADRADVRVDEQKKKVTRLQQDLEKAAAETKDVRRRAAEHRDECRKLQRQLEAVETQIRNAPGDAERREELISSLKGEVAGLKLRDAQLSADLEEARQQAAALERDKARLERAVEAAKEEPVGGPSTGRNRGVDAPPTTGSSPTAEPTPPPANDGLEARLRELKDTLRVKDGLLRKIRTQAEHNRRAYVITQLQLDLVHDELYELRHGHPRRDTEKSRQQRPPVPADAEPEMSDEHDSSREPATWAEPESGPDAFGPTVELEPDPESQDTKPSSEETE